MHPFPPRERAQFISFDRPGLIVEAPEVDNHPKQVQDDEYDRE